MGRTGTVRITCTARKSTTFVPNRVRNLPNRNVGARNQAVQSHPGQSGTGENVTAQRQTARKSTARKPTTRKQTARKSNPKEFEPKVFNIHQAADQSNHTQFSDVDTKPEDNQAKHDGRSN